MSVSGYWAAPASSPAPGVLVLHEARGLTADIRWAVDLLADHGYVTYAPDLSEMMGGVIGALRQLWSGSGPMIDAAHAAVGDVADESDDRSGIGIVGFSMGAALTTLLDDNPLVKVMGLNYGMTPPKAFSSRSVPFLANFGCKDRLLPNSGRSLEKMSTSHDDPHVVHRYANAGHSFMTPVHLEPPSLLNRILGLRYNWEAADQAWKRQQAFFANQLLKASRK